MRCPKCGYISFDAGDRCRNCGYEFSLAAEAAPASDVRLRTGAEPLGPLADLPLARLEPEAEPLPARGDRTLAPPDQPFDLPLFSETARSTPVPTPAAARPPLAVRRATPEVPRVRSTLVRARMEEPTLDLEPEPLAGKGRVRAAVPRVWTPAGLPRRVAGGFIDLVILGLIDAVVLYFTLRLCGLEGTEITRLPVAPFAAFLLLLNSGYLVGFTVAGGQTIGKMATRTRVIGSGDAHVSAGTAVVRTAAYLPSVLPVGLGLMAALGDSDRRALHDRLASTRVVKAP